jgi:hypothetical protein
MADIRVPEVATATPTASDTVLGVQNGQVKRFSVSGTHQTTDTEAQSFKGSRVNGTLAAPTSVLADDILCDFGAGGLDNAGEMQEAGYLRFGVDALDGDDFTARLSLLLRTAAGLSILFNFEDTFFGPQDDDSYQLGWTGGRVSKAYITSVYIGDGTAFITSGTGSPEGAVTAPVGSLYTRTDGGVSTTLYVKTSGTGNTGWTAK